ncbi:MAG: UvrB/UvrC motif-containing protein, partial [Clostridia bacterium]|nr:UvrB/UvrC motif-containing protein [Clostridia bacterium]
KKERVLVVTLTKRMAESLSDYLKSLDLKVRYMHHDIDTLERIEILRDLRMGEFDVLVGINLLREGLDLPEVSLIAILDADKEGFLRNETSLIQIIGRAARNSSGKVIMYADSVTDAMEKAIVETERRRKIQLEYNKEHGIVPKTVVKNIFDTLAVSSVVEDVKKLDNQNEITIKNMSKAEKDRLVKKLTDEMLDAAKKLEFEYAAKLRDELKKLKNS